MLTKEEKIKAMQISIQTIEKEKQGTQVMIDFAQALFGADFRNHPGCAQDIAGFDKKVDMAIWFAKEYRNILERVKGEEGGAENACETTSVQK